MGPVECSVVRKENNCIKTTQISSYFAAGKGDPTSMLCTARAYRDCVITSFGLQRLGKGLKANQNYSPEN